MNVSLNPRRLSWHSFRDGSNLRFGFNRNDINELTMGDEDNVTTGNMSLEYFNNHTSYRPDPYPILREIVLLMHIYGIPVIIGIGLAGNFLTMIVFLSSVMRKMSMNIYLSALAIAESVFLFTLFIIWLEYIDVRIFHVNVWCQVTIYLSYCGGFLSSWFVVLVTAERYIAICFPLARLRICTPSRARNIVIVTAVVCMLLYCSTLWVSGVQTFNDGVDSYDVCSPLPDHVKLHQILTNADTILTLIAPFMMILILNILIAIKISKIYRQRYSLFAFASSSRLSDRSSSPENTRGNSRSSIYSRAQIQITRMLLTMSSIFLLVNTPSYAIRLRLYFKRSSGVKTVQNELEILLQQLFMLLYYTNFAMSFWIYTCSSAKFRSVLRNLCIRQKNNIVTVMHFCNCMQKRHGTDEHEMTAWAGAHKTKMSKV